MSSLVWLQERFQVLPADPNHSGTEPVGGEIATRYQVADSALTAFTLLCRLLHLQQLGGVRACRAHLTGCVTFIHKRISLSLIRWSRFLGVLLVCRLVGPKPFPVVFLSPFSSTERHALRSNVPSYQQLWTLFAHFDSPEYQSPGGCELHLCN